MILSGHQPQFLPGLRYFEKYLRSDLFCHLTGVQMERHSYVNRNYIKGPNGPILLTVPCKNMKHYRHMEINEVEIDDSIRWQDKHLKSIEVAYKKAPYFDEVMPHVELLYGWPWWNLEQICIAFWLMSLKLILGKEKANATSNWVYSDNYNFQGQKSDLVLDMCKQLKADEFIFGELGKDYCNRVAFSEAGIKVHFQNYEPVEYPQQFGKFLPNMSVLDLIMNVAPNKRVNVIMEGGRY